MIPSSEVALALAVGLASALVGVTYRPLRHVVTVIHEAGHALVALLCGRRLHAVRLMRDSSGETVSTGRSRGSGVVFTLLAGYPAPVLVGVAGVWAAVHGRATVWALVLTAVLATTGLLLRNLFGVAVMVAVLVPLAALARYAPAEHARAITLGMCAFLLAAGLRGSLELWARHRGGDDAQSLQAVTFVPARVWKLVFLLVSVAGFVLAARILLDAGVLSDPGG